MRGSHRATGRRTRGEGICWVGGYMGGRFRWLGVSKRRCLFVADWETGAGSTVPSVPLVLCGE